MVTAVIKKAPVSGENLQKTEYQYDGQSRWRVNETYTWNAGSSSWIQQAERRFIYDGMDLIQERDGSNNVVASYVRDGNIDGVLSRTTSSGKYFYHYDGNGNVVAMTNSSGAIVAEYTYDAYGNVTDMSGSQAADNPIRFSTKYFDGNTGYYDFGFRPYDPVTGRWLNRDPIGEEGGLNLYDFVGNSPGNRIDAYGLHPSGHGKREFVTKQYHYFGSSWVSDEKYKWQHENVVDVWNNHGFGKFDYKNASPVTENIVNNKLSSFWVNNRWLSPGEFGNYAVGYAGFMAFGYVGTGANHLLGAIMEKYSQIMGEIRPDGFHHRPWWNWRDGPIDRKLIKEGAKDAARDLNIIKSKQCKVR